MSLARRVEARYEELSPGERRACDAFLAHEGEIALFASTELASIAGVSPATLSRLYKRLGYADVAELREEERSLRAAGVPVADGVPADLGAFAAQEARQLKKALASVADGSLGQAAGLISGAPRVIVVGTRSSYPAALHLRSQLSQVLGTVSLAPAPGQSLGEELEELPEGSVVFLVAFRRRAAVVPRLVAALEVSGASLVVIADGSARAHARRAEVWLECPVGSPGPFDSSGAAMSLVCVLANEVAALADAAGRQRVRRVSALYESLAEIEG